MWQPPRYYQRAPQIVSEKLLCLMREALILYIAAFNIVFGDFKALIP